MPSTESNGYVAFPYELKANGKHEIGVIAEEVGSVVPEIVQWDKTVRTRKVWIVVAWRRS